MSLQNIQQNPQNISNIYLAHISQQLSTQPNGSQSYIPNTLPNTTEPFIPPTSCVWVNGLWSLSLVISLTGALMTTLLQHWARRYLKLANSRCYPQEKARIHAFYRHGVEKLYIKWTIEAVPPLLHLSLFLFFAGLSVFLFCIHSTIFKIVTTWIALCTILYTYFAFLPIIHKDSPYSAPPSALVFFCLTGLRYLFFQILRRFPQMDPPVCMPLHRRDPSAVHLGDFFSTTLSKTAEEFALKQRPDIDYHSFLRTFESLYEDTDLEKFFEGLSCLCDGGTGNGLNIQEGFIIPHRKKLSIALIDLMNRTLSSNLVTEFVKRRRMVICTKTIDLTSVLGPWCFIRCVLFGEWSKFLECVEFGLFVQKWKSTDKVASFAAQCVAALTISIVRDRNRDEHWLQLVNGLHNASEFPLPKYIAHGDSLPLANVIFIVRRTIQTYSGAKERHRNDILKASSKTLKTVCKLNIGDTCRSSNTSSAVYGTNSFIRRRQTNVLTTRLSPRRRSRIFASYILLYTNAQVHTQHHFLLLMIGTPYLTIQCHTPCARLMTIVLPCRSRTCNLTSQCLTHQEMSHSSQCPSLPLSIHPLGHRTSRLSTLLIQHHSRLHQLRLRPLYTHGLVRLLLLWTL